MMVAVQGNPGKSQAYDAAVAQSAIGGTATIDCGV